MTGRSHMRSQATTTPKRYVPIPSGAVMGRSCNGMVDIGQSCRHEHPLGAEPQLEAGFDGQLGSDSTSLACGT